MRGICNKSVSTFGTTAKLLVYDASKHMIETRSGYPHSANSGPTDSEPGLADVSTGNSYVPADGWTSKLLKSRTKICYYDLVSTILGPDVLSTG